MAKAARTIGIAMHFSPTSKLALKWAIHNLINEADRIILINVQPPKLDHTSKNHFQEAASTLLKETDLSKQYGIEMDPEVIAILDTLSNTKEAKVYCGDPRMKLCIAVEDLHLDTLVVGSRGLGTVQRLLKGSVSDYVVRNASCPVIVVKGNSSSNFQH